MKKIIAFDIDDTIMNNKAIEADMLKKFMEERLNISGYIGPIDTSTSNLKKRYPAISENILNEFNNWYFPKMVNDGQPYPMVKETIDLLRSSGYSIYIVTRRDENYDKSEYKGWMMKRDTLAWFERNGIVVDKFYFSCFDKLKTCLNNNIGILVEDDPINIVRVSHSVDVIMKLHKYNEYCMGDRIHSIDDYDPEGFLYLCDKIYARRDKKSNSD